MLAVVRLRGEESRWRALYGAPLSVEERFFAVMLWSWQRERRALRERLRRVQARRLEALKLPTTTALPVVAGMRTASPFVGPES
jgi:hypothetical protein